MVRDYRVSSRAAFGLVSNARISDLKRQVEDRLHEQGNVINKLVSVVNDHGKMITEIRDSTYRLTGAVETLNKGLMEVEKDLQSKELQILVLGKLIGYKHDVDQVIKKISMILFLSLRTIFFKNTERAIAKEIK